MTNIVEQVRNHITTTNTFSWMLRILAVFGTVSVLIFVYGMFFEPPYIRYQNLPFPVATPVEQGRTVPIIIERCNDSKNERVYMSARTLVNTDNGVSVQLPEATVSLKPGCDRTISRSVTVPIETPPGNYRIEGEAIAQGLVRKQRVDWYTEQFQVIPIKPITKELKKENEATGGDAPQ